MSGREHSRVPAGRGAHGSRLRASLAIASIALAVTSACTDRRTGDLDEIRASGVLRVAVRPGFFDARAPEGGDGDHETQLRHLAARLGTEIRWLEPKRHDQLLEMLADGRADLAVSRFSPEALRGTEAAPTAAVEWVDDELVAGAAMPDLNMEDLRGGVVEVQLSALSPSIGQRLEQLGLEVVPAPEEMSAEAILAAVADGDMPLTVADSGLVGRAPSFARLQLVGRLGSSRPVVWAVRAGNVRLRRAVDDFLFAEKVLIRGSRTPACRDLPEIRRARVLRLVTRNSPMTCYVARGGLEGFEYELAVAFAREQRLRLELSIPPPGVDPLVWLERGYGDLAALHEPADPATDGGFLVSRPYRRVDLVSVVSRRRESAFTVEELAGMEVSASRPVAELVRLLPLEPVIDATTPEPGADAFSALREVARGQSFAAVVDRDAARIELDGRDDLVVGPRVLPDVRLVWVLNATSPALRDAVDGFLGRARRSGLVRQLAQKSLGRWRTAVSPRLPPIPDGHLTPYDEYVTWAARRYGLDWRLLASLMYEESRFDPDAVGPGGSAGLFQLMPSTWRELGVEDPHHPGEAIEAGARYLSSLMTKFDDLDLPDRVAMAIASYNVGPRHVFDARRLAEQMGLDPDRWAGNVETAMFILDDPEVARNFPAGVCRCRRGAAYTRRILRRYAAYAEQFPPA